MAGGSCFIWILLLLSCVFQLPDSRHVPQDVHTSVSHEGSAHLKDILSHIPITLPDGIDPNNINITSIIIKTCTGLKEQLTLLSKQLQETTLKNRQLDEESFGLKSKVRLLEVQLATCSSTAPAVSGCYHTELQNRIKQLLETFDSDAFQILKIIQLTNEVNTLQNKIRLAAVNSTESTAASRLLQTELQENINELNAKKQLVERSNTNSILIFDIITLQKEIWALEHEESRKGGSSLQPDKRILDLQEQLNKKISELRGTGDASTDMLELISVHSKIAAIERLIAVYIEKSKTDAADYQRQWRQKTDLLKQKILQLNRNENDQKLTEAILQIQGEVEHLRQLIANTKKMSDSQVKELRVTWQSEKKQQERLQKQLEETDYAQAQLIIKIISTMKELREAQTEETTSTNPTTLLALLQVKERDYAKAQAEIKELQRKLLSKTEQCSGPEERYDQAKTEFELKIAELNSTRDSKAALILTAINLNDEIRALKELIVTTENPERISELQRQLEEKQQELNSKTADIERLIDNHITILRIIQLQDDIKDHEKTAINGTTGNRLRELQNKVDGLISEIDNRDENTKLMLKILTLQSLVEQLRKQLSDLDKLHIGQVTQLRNDLTTKRKELQEYINKLSESNQTSARLILTITNLHNQLRRLEEDRRNVTTTSSSIITQLREELRVRKLEHSRDQAQIQILKDLLESKKREHDSAQTEVNELQRKLQLKTQDCSGTEERYEQAKTEFEQTIAELKSGDAKAALTLNIMNLQYALKTLTDLITSTKDKDKISELQRQLEDKQDELYSKTAELEGLIPDSESILTIIQLQTDLRDLQKNDKNGTTGNQVAELQNRVDGFINKIDDEKEGNVKLILKIITLQSQVEQLQRLVSNLRVMKTNDVAQLTNDLTTTKNQLQKYIDDLSEKNQTNAKLILRITDLTNQLRNLRAEKENEGQTTSATVINLREQLKMKVEEQLQDQAKIKDLQDKLNQTEAQCSSFEQKLKELQNELDGKMNELLSKSDTVTSLALQISTLTLQLEESKRQLQNTESATTIKELQKTIDDKSKELAKKTEQLKTRSPQAQRLLQIITIHSEIEKFVNVAANDTDYAKIRALEDRLNNLIEGIRDEENEHTKFTFQVLAQQDEIARLKKQEERQTKAYFDKIAELQNELDHIRNQIREKTLLLESSDTRITNLSSQIMDLHQKIKPLEDEISYIQETNAENLAELQRRVNLTKRQLQDSELRLSEADAKNFNLIMEIVDLRSQLKKAEKKAPRNAERMIQELEEKVETQQREIKNLERTNTDLKQEVSELKMSCNENADCQDVQMQLQQSQEEVDRLQQQLQDKDAAFRQLQEESEEQAKITNRLQKEYNNLEKQFQLAEAFSDNLQKQMFEKDTILTQLQQELDGRTTDYNKLQDDYNNLQNEKSELEERVRDLQTSLTDKEDKTIHTRKITFDPNTAHPRIVLSADNTEMSTTAEIQQVPDNPRRFDVDLAVMGSTGFLSGRQYWEVSVAGKLCYHVGMASESAPRKGTILYSPGIGYWTILLNKQGQFRAIDRKPTVIQVQTPPLRLGILLDYKNGQISFYDAGARAHMYSFAGQRFTDRIFPFVNFCVEEVDNQIPIVLLTPGSSDWIK
ncbi:coiled-coil domain-containing protein 18 [Anabas testudineus]|uniref:B30.2/SPRY domain-containing protein n=1 Tax=Anabas testudineus TaxID=64144 RepID=A0AAQ6IN92_ANATE|nr:coiled-coil domain-containing protein 18 [Anabas testudineus]